MRVNSAHVGFFRRVGVCAACIAPSGLAFAQNAPGDSVTAQALFDGARKLIAEGKYADACPKLEESQRLDPGTGTLLNLADCYEREGKIATAWSKFLEAAAAAHSGKQAERERLARDRAAAVYPRVSSLSIKVVDPAIAGLEIRRDGAVIGPAQWGTPIPIDPGDHRVTAGAPGRRVWQSSITVGSTGQTASVTVPELETGAASASMSSGDSSATGAASAATADESVTPGKGLRIGSYAALGVGVVGVAAGALFVVQSSGKRKDADDAYAQCASPCLDGDPQAANVRSLDDKARSAKTLATVAFVVGGVGVATGITLFVLSNKKSGESAGNSSLRTWVGPGSVGIAGAF